MGQKTPPRLNRLNVVASQRATGCWFAKRTDFSHALNQDLQLRKYFEKFEAAGIDRINIERTHQNITATVFCARPGIMIGRKGADVDTMKAELTKSLGVTTHVNVKEVKKPDLQAKLVSEGIAKQLENRVMFRKAMKRAMQNTMRAGAIGVRIEVSGRLGGAEIARSEKYHAGRVPLHTFKADIDYHIATALTTYGIIGIKVWVYRADFDAKSPRRSAKKIEETTK